MLRGAGGCRAIGVIAAVIASMSSALAQDDAARLVDQFARDAQRAEARKAEAGRKAAAALPKQDVQKAKPSELRKRAQAQHAKAVARRKAAEAQAAEQERARQEAEEQRATAEIRQLIQEAEAARMRAEKMLPTSPVSAAAGAPQPATAHDAERQARDAKAAAARAADAAHAAAARVAQHKRRVSAFARARRLRNARITAHAQRLAEEREAQRLREERRKAALARAEAHRARAKLARVAEARWARAQAAARAEAERALALAMAAEQAHRKAEAQARAEAESKERATEQARLAAEQRARAEAEQAQRLAEQARRDAEAQARAEAERKERAAEQAQLAAEQRARAEAEHAQRLAEQARRDAEAKARAEAERIRLVEQTREKALARDNAAVPEATSVESKALSPPEIKVAANPTAPSRLGGPLEPVADPGHVPLRQAGQWNGQVTVLMVMAPGTYGIRRRSRTADPLLCTLDGCYISTGSDMAALFKPRRKALGFGNTFGRRAGACRRQLGCIFRGVTFDFPGMLQPVDLHILKHDRRRPQVVLADSNCRVAAGQLACRRPVLGDDYVMWVLPEWLADRAGPELLERALRTGLSPVRSAGAYPSR